MPNNISRYLEEVKSSEAKLSGPLIEECKGCKNVTNKFLSANDTSTVIIKTMLMVVVVKAKSNPTYTTYIVLCWSHLCQKSNGPIQF